MNTRKIAAEYRLTHWSEVVKDQKDSGLSIRAYCESAGIHENAYYYWLKKLRETACTELAEVRGNKPGMAAMGFTEVILPAQAAITPDAATNENQISIEVAGMRIVAGSGYPTAKLAELLQGVARI